MLIKNKIIPVFLISILLLQIVFISASVSDTRQNWKDLKQISKDKQVIYKQAQQKYQENQSLENEQEVIDTGKATLNAALNEVEAWLRWKTLEAEENPFASQEVKQAVYDDVNANIAKIDALRTEVNAVSTRAELGIIFIKMIGKYLELLTDVMRDSGKMWVHIANTRADKLTDYEQKLRDAAQNINDNSAIIKYLDDAKSQIESARTALTNAQNYYEQIRVGGTPLIKFSEANQQLNKAREEMLKAGNNLRQAFKLMIK